MKFSDSLIVVYVYSALPVVTKFNVWVYLVRGYERDRTVFTFLLFIQNRTQRKMVSISRLWFIFATLFHIKKYIFHFWNKFIPIKLTVIKVSIFM